MMIVRYNSVKERFVSFIKLFGDTWSGLFASVDRQMNRNSSVYCCLLVMRGN